MDDGLRRAVEVLGSKSALARLIGVKHQAVMQWSRVPAEHCITIQDACAREGARVLAKELRPDVFRDPEVPLPARAKPASSRPPRPRSRKRR